MPLNFIYAAYNIIQLASADYIPEDDPIIGGIVLGYTPKNWNQGLALTKLTIRNLGEGYTGNKKAGKVRSLSVIYNTLAEINFLVDADF